MKMVTNQSKPKFRGTIALMGCTYCINVVILVTIAGELWPGQVENLVKSDFRVKFDLEGQGQSTPKSMGILTKVFCIFWSKHEYSSSNGR